MRRIPLFLAFSVLLLVGVTAANAETGALITAAVLVLALPARAQQVTGTPGSPSATTSIDGKQLPPPPPTFGGVIKESAKGFHRLAIPRCAA